MTDLDFMETIASAVAQYSSESLAQPWCDVGIRDQEFVVTGLRQSRKRFLQFQQDALEDPPLPHQAGRMGHMAQVTQIAILELSHDKLGVPLDPEDPWDKVAQMDKEFIWAELIEHYVRGRDSAEAYKKNGLPEAAKRFEQAGEALWSALVFLGYRMPEKEEDKSLSQKLKDASWNIVRKAGDQAAYIFAYQNIVADSVGEAAPEAPSEVAPETQPKPKRKGK